MKRFLLIGFTTCVVSFGVWFALFFVGGILTLFGEGDYERFRLFSIGAIVVGIIAGLFWASRRMRGIAIRAPDWALLVFAILSLAYLGQYVVRDEAYEFLAFDSSAAARHNSPIKAGDNLTLIGTTVMGVRVYSVDRRGKPYWVVGVYPRYKLWWINAYSMGLQDYQQLVERGTLDKPIR